ncbi:MAG: hypothetical protein WAV46_01885 [Candidatus Moraniibacteriota bacterium]
MSLFNKDSSRNLVIVGLVLLALAEAVSLAFVGPSQSGTGSVRTQDEQPADVAQAPIQKLSEIRGARIDDGAGTIVVERSLSAQVQARICLTLPGGLWIFLLLGYVALLIFNFSYTFDRATAPQWAWEAGLTALALIAWYAWDECRTSSWFPLMVVKSGLLVFIAYAYLLEKKLWVNSDKTGSLF